MKLNTAKKLTAGALALSMMFAMAVPMAFAETPHDMTSVTVKKLYKLEGNGVSPEETFTLKQTKSEVVDSEAKTAPALGAITGAYFAEGAATTAGATGTITIQLPTYEKVGIYKYTLEEEAGSTAGVAYYGNEIKLVVTVVNDDTGKVRVAAVHTEAENENGGFDSITKGEGGKSDTFANTYKANELEVSKDVTGNLGDKEKLFQFHVTFTKKSTEDAPKLIKYEDATGEHTIAFGTNGKATVDFKLKDDSELHFTNIPEGVDYTVWEDSYAANGYKTYIGSETEDNEDSSAEGTATTEKAAVAFINHKGDGEIDTGVILDNAPYILMLAVVAGAAMTLVIKKRREEE